MNFKIRKALVVKMKIKVSILSMCNDINLSFMGKRKRRGWKRRQQDEGGGRKTDNWISEHETVKRKEQEQQREWEIWGKSVRNRWFLSSEDSKKRIKCNRTSSAKQKPLNVGNKSLEYSSWGFLNATEIKLMINKAIN